MHTKRDMLSMGVVVVWTQGRVYVRAGEPGVVRWPCAVAIRWAAVGSGQEESCC